MRTCLNCGSNKTSLMKNKYERWNRYKDRYREGYLCQKCYAKLISNPKSNPINNHLRNKNPDKTRMKLYNPKRIAFLGKRILLAWNPRKGICFQCNKKIGEEYVNYKGQTAIMMLTHIHHLIYLPIMVWAGTIELCVSCHDEKRIEIGRKRKEKEE